jgi:predicted CXXCH cytochrome family protein
MSQLIYHMNNFFGRRKSYLKQIIALNLLILFISAAHSYGDDITNTLHNLSISGPGTVKSTVEVEVCIFCHAPHKASFDNPPLWNCCLSEANYIPYQSTSLYANVGQPTGASNLRLSCHDGTVALGALLSKWGEAPFEGGLRFMPPGRTLIGTDLTDDHPVSFVFDTQLMIDNGQLFDPGTLPAEVRLDQNEMLQCTSCHNPHGTANPKFLVKSRSFSELCRSCHDKEGWGITSHSTVSATWNGAGTDPWPHTPFTTVDENACENCHDPHSAGSDERILNYFFEEDNCFTCHNGNVASTNIETQFTKTYIHPVQNFAGVHSPAEDATTMQKHVECFDCHNPHWANSSNPPQGAPEVSGRNQGVTGIDESGQPVDEALNLYEICYKCHGDNNVKTVAPVNRLYPEINVRLEFDPSNPSYHPVEAIGANPDVPSLTGGLTENSIIYCTDCHNNNELTGPRGTHGSTNHFILERRYDHIDNRRIESQFYAMCFKCHSESNLLGDNSFEHDRHLRSADTACFVCHDPHGISATQGNPNNNAHLINFNLDIVNGNSFAQPRFENLGTPSARRGACNLNCHGETHGGPDDGRDDININGTIFRQYDCPC